MTFDVFFTYNDRDKASVRRLAEKLKDRHLKVWFDEWEPDAGTRWQDVTEETIAAAKSAVVPVGEDGLGPWQDRQQEACLEMFRNREIPIIVVFLQGAGREPALPLYLLGADRVDLRDGLTDRGVDQLADLISKLTFRGDEILKDFFVSYNKNDEKWAEWIAFRLEEAGYNTVIQAWDFRPGGDFVVEMQKAVTGTKRTIAVLSQDYLNAKYTQAEWANAFARDTQGNERTLLPIRVKMCKPTGLLKTRIYVDLVGLSEAEAREKLLESVDPIRPKPPVPSPFPGPEPGPQPAPPRPFPAPPVPPEKAMDVWREKLEFLRKQEPIAVSANERFSIRKQIEEVERKIRELAEAGPR